jgi:hypothetical protein
LISGNLLSDGVSDIPELIIEEADPSMNDPMRIINGHSVTKKWDKRGTKGQDDDEVDPLYASDDEDERSTGTVGQEQPPLSIEVKVVQGGPVTPLFQARTEVRHKHVSFS